MIKRTPQGDIVTSQRTFSTRTWFGFPPGTPLERIIVATAPVVTPDARARLRLLRTSVQREG